MTLIARIQAFFSGTPQSAPVVAERLEMEHRLMSYMIGLVNREDLIAEEIASHKKIAAMQDPWQQKLAYAKLYFQLESFLVKNTPLVTKKEFKTPKDVRTFISGHIATRELSAPVRLIFAPESVQAALLLNLALTPLLQHVFQNLGEAVLLATVTKATNGTLLKDAPIRNGTLDITPVLSTMAAAPPTEVNVLFRKVYTELFDKSTVSLGPKSTAAVATGMFSVVAEHYDQVLLSFFLDAVPEGYLESQKILTLSREELEKRVIEATRSLQEEKASVEKKVIERTKELTEANNRLTELDKIKTEFISVAAHQLRTPLAAIKWTIGELIDEDSENLSAKQRSFLFKVQESNERMLRLIAEMLVVTRIESGKMQYALSFMHIEDLIDNILLDFEGPARARHIDLSFTRPPTPLPLVYVDPEKVRAVIQNLIENAMNYTKDGGAISVFAALEGTMVKVSIKDNGIGIPKHQQTSLFNKFFRADNASRTKTDGSGLGLFVAKSIIDRLHGRIGFDSEEGVGTTFYFTVPSEEIHL